MFTKRLVLMIVTSSIVFSGCGTIGARATTKNPPPFAGLRADFQTFGEVFTNKEEIKPALVYWLGVPLISGIILADIPVSAFFDLYCLPWDLARHDHQPEQKEDSVKE